MNTYLQRTSFDLSLLSLTGVLALLWFQKIPGTSADFLIPAILGVYITGESAKKISAHYNARLDSDADTASVIMSLEGQKPTADASKPAQAPEGNA